MSWCTLKMRPVFAVLMLHASVCSSDTALWETTMSLTIWIRHAIAAAGQDARALTKESRISPFINGSILVKDLSTAQNVLNVFHQKGTWWSIWSVIQGGKLLSAKLTSIGTRALKITKIRLTIGLHRKDPLTSRTLRIKKVCSLMWIS